MTNQVETLRQKRKALRGLMKRKRSEVNQRIQQHLARSPGAKKNKWRNRLLWAALLLILMLCLSRCECTSPGPAPAQKGRAVVVKVEKVLAPHKKPQAAPPTRTATRPRAQYKAESPVEPPWVEAFRLQVAARSQRLAECFVGVSKPGAIRWAASLTADTGAVFDQKIEPVPPGEDLTPEQQHCVMNVLEKPRYQKLATTYAAALPETVSLVLEF